ncbi:MAG: hypothetical protein ACAI35_20380, partial [Candidatus Methylacidiphilales bacterium]
LSPFLLPLGSYDYDVKAETFVMERIISHSKDFGAAVAAAIRMDLKDAVPHLMKNLTDPRAQAGLLRLGDLRIVRQLKQALPKLSREERPAVEMLVIRLSTNDPLMAMLDYVEDTKCPARSVALAYLDEVSDPRAVPAAAFMMKEDPDPQARITAIRCLTRIARKGDRDALKALMEGLEVRFERLPGSVNEKAVANAMYRGEIAESLRAITRQNYGMDAQGWYAWYKDGDSAPGANTTAMAANSAPRKPSPFGPPMSGGAGGDMDSHGNPETDALPQGEMVMSPSEEGITYTAPDGTPGDDNSLPTHDAPEAPLPPSLKPRRTDPFAPAWPLVYTPAPDPSAPPADGEADADYPRRDENLRWSTRLQVGSHPSSRGSRAKAPAAELAKLQGPPVPEVLSRPVTYMMASAPELMSGPPTPGSFYARVFAKSNQYHLDGTQAAGGTMDGNGGSMEPRSSTPATATAQTSPAQHPADKKDAQDKSKDDWTRHALTSARRSLDAVMRPPRQLAAAFRDMEDATRQGPPLPGPAPIEIVTRDPEMPDGVPTLASLQKATTPYIPGKDAPVQEGDIVLPPSDKHQDDMPATTSTTAAVLPVTNQAPGTQIVPETTDVPGITMVPVQSPVGTTPATENHDEAPQSEVLAASPGAPVLPPIGDEPPKAATPAPSTKTVAVTEPVESPERLKMLAALAEAKALADAAAAKAGEAHAQADTVVPEPNEKLADFLAEAGTPILAAPNRALQQRRAAETLAMQQNKVSADLTTTVSRLSSKDRKKAGNSHNNGEAQGDDNNGLRFPLQSRGNLLSIREEYTPMPDSGDAGKPGTPASTNSAPISRADVMEQTTAPAPAPTPAPANNSQTAPGPVTSEDTVPMANAPSATMLAEAGTPIAIPNSGPRGDGNGGTSLASASSTTHAPASAPGTAKAAPAPSHGGTTLSRIFTELVFKPQSAASAPAPAPTSTAPARDQKITPSPADSDLPPTAAPLMQMLDDAGK